MADIIFEHVLPDETYDNPGHPLHGYNKRVLYALGLWYSQTANQPEEQQFETIEEFVDYISNNFNEAKEKYALYMNNVLIKNIRKGVRGFLKKSQNVEFDVDVETELQ